MMKYKLCSECGRNRPLSCYPVNKGERSIRCCDCMFEKTRDNYLDFRILGASE